MTVTENTHQDTPNKNEHVIIRKYEGELLQDFSYLMVGILEENSNHKVVCAQCDGNKKELNKCMEDGFSVFGLSIPKFDLALSFGDLSVKDCPDKICADFNIKLVFAPDETLAEFLLTQFPQDKTEYTISDLQEHLKSDLYDLHGELKRILVSEDLQCHLLENYGKDAWDFFNIFNKELPSFLRLQKINSAKFYSYEEASQSSQDMLDSFTVVLQQALPTEQDQPQESKLPKCEELREQIHRSKLWKLIRLEELNEQAIKTIIAGIDKTRIEIVETMVKTERDKARLHRILFWLKWPLIILLLIGGIFCGKYVWEKHRKQQPELLIKIVNYENCRKEFNEKIWPELMALHNFEKPEIYENEAIFRAKMSEETRSKVISYLQQCQRKRYIKLTSIRKEDLSASDYDLVGYSLTMQNQAVKTVAIIVEGNDPENKIASYINENFGVDKMFPHPEKANAVVFLTNTSFTDFIALKTTFVKDIEAIHPGAIVEDNILQSTVTVSFIDDAIKTYRFDLRGISAVDKQAAISKMLKGHPVVLGFITGKFRATDMTEIKAVLDAAGFTIAEETEKDGVITMILKEKMPVYTYRITAFSSQDPAPIIESLKQDKNLIHLQCTKKEHVGTKYRCDVSVTTYLSSAYAVRELFENNKLKIYSIE